MYMQGFSSPSRLSKESCLVFLFPSWVIDSRVKMAFSCLGTAALGLLLELVIRFRRTTKVADKADKTKPHPYVVVTREIALFGVQALLGYLLMLLVMTYSVPIFVCGIVGLIIGHAVFNVDAPAKEGATPCCEGVVFDDDDEGVVSTYQSTNGTVSAK
jgi:hypothetical protein